MIYRIVRKRRNFTMIDNAVLRDHRLSFKATGLLAYLLSMPDDWSPRREVLALAKTDGETSIRGALAELVECGYLVRKVERQPNGTTVTVSEIHESPLVGNPPVVNGATTGGKTTGG